MRLCASSLLLSSLPLLALLPACGAPEAPLGTAAEAITVCAGPSTLKGVDVSHYDGTIDWAQVKEAGIAFAFAKATEGTTYTDPTFATNWAAMKKNGVARGAYHFFHSNDDPVAQATWFLDAVGTLEPGDLPPTLDLEVTDSETAATITTTAIKWLDTVAAATGTTPILYVSPSFVTGTLGSPAGLENHARLWVANWGVSCPDVPAPFTTWPFWQDSATGTVSGIPGSSGAVDLDEFNGTLAALTAIGVQGSSSSSTTGSSTTGSSTTGSSSSGGSSSGGAGGAGGAGASSGAGGATGTASGGTGAASSGAGGAGSHLGSASSSARCSVSPAGAAGPAGEAPARAGAWLLALALGVARARRGFVARRRRFG